MLSAAVRNSYSAHSKGNTVQLTKREVKCLQNLTTTTREIENEANFSKKRGLLQLILLFSFLISLGNTFIQITRKKNLAVSHEH